MDISKQTIRCCGAGQTNLNSLPSPPRIMDRASYLQGDKTFFLVLAKPDLAKKQFSSIHLELYSHRTMIRSHDLFEYECRLH